VEGWEKRRDWIALALRWVEGLEVMVTMCASPVEVRCGRGGGRGEGEDEDEDEGESGFLGLEVWARGLVEKRRV
jgi:hypothetical protein